MCVSCVHPVAVVAFSAVMIWSDLCAFIVMLAICVLYYEVCGQV